MAEEISVTFDTQPFNDSFLPRYLTVHLLKILADTLEKPTITKECVDLIKSNAKFIKNFKHKDLFTPFTYSIFWREDTNDLLSKYKATLDKPDKYNCTALTLAIANEDFALACQLLNKGATLRVEDKLVLEIALISIMQRNEHFTTKIFSQKNNLESWVLEYLEYLHSYIKEGSTKKIFNYHEVMNLPIRTFGQALDTETFFNGMPSHFGFLGPAIDTLTTHLNSYTNSINDEVTKDIFTKVTAAFTSTKNTCKYLGNIVTANDAAQILADKIINNINNDHNDATILFGGWAGNAVTIACVNKILIYSNLGIGGDQDATTKFFAIINPQNINAQMVNTFINGLGYAKAAEEILALLGNIVEAEPLFSIKQTAMAIDNCVFINPRAIVQGILLALAASEKNKTIELKNLTAVAANTDTLYSAYLEALHKQSAMDLAKVMRNKKLSPNMRIECCALALDYINQHYANPDTLLCCIELKNALEFVGLGGFYTNMVNLQAKQTIQTAMIHTQEQTAVQVAAQRRAAAVSLQQNKKT